MQILLVDDEPLSLNSLNDLLGTIFGHQVTRCESGEEALEHFREHYYPMVLSDIRMPVMDGIDLLRRLKALPEGPRADVVLITGHGDMETAVSALRAGAYDYLKKPINVDELAAIVERVMEHQKLLIENYELTRHFDEVVSDAVEETKAKFNRLKTAYGKLFGIGRIGIFSRAMREIMAMTERLHEDRTIPVLIEGETGTGKEVIARLIHYGRDGNPEPFVSINCSSIPEQLFESELFGYEGGTFTGSRKEGMKGKFELAEGGTLFLDEIGDLPLELQPKLLRAIQEREIYRVGGIKLIRLNIRIIGATNQRLQDLVERGAFRRDLFYRLNVGSIELPPLRERKDAIRPLAELILDKVSEQRKRGSRTFTDTAVAILEQYSWPGNIRELENAIERVVLLYDDAMVRPEHLKFLTDGDSGLFTAQGMPLDPDVTQLPPDKLDLRELEDRIIERALAKFNGNKTRTAAYLGITRSTLKNRLKK